jgi:predicted regulator of Ras-like GTPase activity (Roadblock/LC7/MglB family)
MNTSSGALEINQLLATMNESGGFAISILTDAQGLPIASAAAPGIDPDRQAAVVAFMQKAAIQVSKQLGMGTTDEISLYDSDGQRLVCRPFNVHGYDLVLATMVGSNQKSYRRITNSAISEIGHIWSHYWG